MATVSEYIGEATNNQAEYRAVLAAIKKARSLGANELEFYLDSELVSFRSWEGSSKSRIKTWRRFLSKSITKV